METALIQSEYELERGKPMPSYLHGHLQALLSHLILRDYMKTFSVISELSLEIGNHKKTPDLSIYQKRPVNFSKDEVRVKEPPLCAIEILSPTQSLTELTSKCEEYFEMGIQSYWLILPELRSIYVFKSRTNHTAFTKDQKLKDTTLNIEIDLAELFEEV